MSGSGVAILSVVSVLLLGSAARADTLFNLQFDNQDFTQATYTTDGPLVPPLIGSGTFVSPRDLAPGTYDLASLPGFTVDLSFSNGDTYTQADITTELSGVAVRIVQDGSGERLFFTESGGAGSDGSPLGGALDFFHVDSFLSFEPTHAGGNYLYLENNFAGVGPETGGRYLATSGATTGTTPEPPSFALLLTGLPVLWFVAGRRVCRS